MKISKHAFKRAIQRGFHKEDIDIICNFGIEIQKPGKAVELSLRRKEKEKLILELKRLIKAIENASNKGILMDRDYNEILTVYYKRN